MERKLIVLRGSGGNGLIKAAKNNNVVTLELRVPIRGDIELAVVTEKDEMRFDVRDFSGAVMISCGDVNLDTAAFFVISGGLAVFEGCRSGERRNYEPKRNVSQKKSFSDLSGNKHETRLLHDKVAETDAPILKEEKEIAEAKSENAFDIRAQSTSRERRISDIFPSLGEYADNAVADENYFDIAEGAEDFDSGEMLAGETDLSEDKTFEYVREAEAEPRTGDCDGFDVKTLEKAADSIVVDESVKQYDSAVVKSDLSLPEASVGEESDDWRECKSCGVTVSITGESAAFGIKSDSKKEFFCEAKVSDDDAFVCKEAKSESFGSKARERRAMRKKVLRAKDDDICVAPITDCEVCDASGRKLTFYERVSDDVERLLKNGKREEILEERFPFSRWVGIWYDERRRYVVGVIGQQPHYICYGLPAPVYDYPPSSLGDCARWLPLDVRFPDGAGYWLIYQDCETGECVKDTFCTDAE